MKRQCTRNQLATTTTTTNHEEIISSEDIIISILNKLPLNSLMRFKCVSKRWHELITHRTKLPQPRHLIGFIGISTTEKLSYPSDWLPYSSNRDDNGERHVSPSQMEYAQAKYLAFRRAESWVNVVACSKGILLCNEAPSPLIYWVCNPFTHQKITLPILNRPVHYYVPSKIGFDCQVITDEASGLCVMHFVVIIIGDSFSQEPLSIMIYSSRDEHPEWKEFSLEYPVKQQHTLYTDHISRCSKPGFAIGGIFYWDTDQIYPYNHRYILMAFKPLQDYSCRFWKVELPDVLNHNRCSIGAVKDSHLYVGALILDELQVWTSCKLKTNTTTNDDHVPQYNWKLKHRLRLVEFVKRHPEAFGVSYLHGRHKYWREIKFKGFHPCVQGVIFFIFENKFMSYTFKGDRLEVNPCQVSHLCRFLSGPFLPLEWLPSLHFPLTKPTIV